MSQLVVIAHNIRSLHNVGSIFRTAEAAGVTKVFLTGYTGTPPRNEISKVALGSEMRIPWQHAKNIGSVLSQLRRENFYIVALEQDAASVDYRKVNVKPNANVALIVGNEVLGISKPLRAKADIIAEIPMLGGRKSLNVSVAFGIAIYALAHQRKS